MGTPLEVLQTYFGYSAFRKGQEEIIDAILAGRDVLGIMPTGAGKSICYQVPALMMDGISVILSPLISLMEDQVNALVQAGVPVAYINSSLNASQLRTVMDRAAAGQYKLLYVAPERLENPEFRGFLMRCPLSMVCVDEAHCVSQWGQDFRPSYLAVAPCLRELPSRPVICAFTATATGIVQQDIAQLLELRRPHITKTGFDRPNLHFAVEHPRNKAAALQVFLQEHRQQSGIVYCLTRKTVEELCAQFTNLGFEATRYHAGLSPGERQANQDAFQRDEKTVMFATNAFGMGIDKSNVSYVVHYNMPKNLEAYYQEAGRAGRDGTEAECLLYFAPRDIVTLSYFIDNMEGEGLEPEAFALFQSTERRRLNQMIQYCKTTSCLRQYILRYFGETAPEECGNCSNCGKAYKDRDITVEAQKILSCVRRMEERFGESAVVGTLRGMKRSNLLDNGFDRLSTYGIMKEYSERDIRDMISHLVLNEYLVSTESKYPVLRWGPKARGVLFQDEPVVMKVAEATSDSGERGGRKRSARAARSEPANSRLFLKLQALRRTLADQQSVPAYVVFPDVTLMEMCDKLPVTKSALLEISGVGLKKLERYGDAFLEALQEEWDRQMDQ